MNNGTSHTRSLIALFAALLLTTATAFAAPSGDKSPEEEKAEQRQKAVKELNAGQKHLAAAKEYEAASDSLFAYNYRATSNEKARKEYEQAVKRYDKAIKLNAELYEAHSDRGYCLRKLGLLEESLKAYNTALTLSPDYGPALEYRGEAFLALGQLENAEKALARLQELADGDSAENKAYGEWAATLAGAIEKFHLEQFQKSDSLPKTK